MPKTKPGSSKFPETVYCTKVRYDDDLKSDVHEYSESMEDFGFDSDGRIIAVYKLVGVKELKVVTKFDLVPVVDESPRKNKPNARNH